MTKEFDSSAKAMVEQMSKMLAMFKFKEIDVQPFVDSQRKNLSAMSQAAQITAEGATAISERQLEIFEATSKYLSSILRDSKLSPAQRNEVVRQAFETAVTNARELAEMTAKSNNEVFDIFKRRVTDSLDQLLSRSLVGKAD